MPVAKPESSDARIIAHIDMDCFYVQVEQRKQPDLRGLPSAVVQYNSWKGGGLIAVSYEARKYGVTRSMRGDEAKQVCPQIHLVQVPVARGKADLNTYRNAGSEVVSVLSRKGRCERASIDEVYLDLTDAAEIMLAETPPESLEVFDEEALKSHVLGLNIEDGSDAKENVREWLCRSDADCRDKLLACGALIVADLRMQVLKETEFTCSAGIAHNKMLAKLASAMNKPAQQTIVPFSSVKGLLESFPIKKMKQLGGKLGTSLQCDLGVSSVGDLLKFSEEKLQEHYGINTGTWLWNISRGISGEEVQGRLLPKSHGSGKTFPGPRALKTIASVQHWLNELCEELSERLCSDLDQNKRIAHTLTLHARAYKSSDSDSHKKFPSKSCPLRYGTAKIQEDALSLFQAGLREYMGSYRSKTQGSQYNGWGITGLSVSASKIVDIPSGTCSIMKYFHNQYSPCSSSKQSKDNFIQEASPMSPSGSESYSGLNLTELQIEFPGEETKIEYAGASLDQQEDRKNLWKNQDASCLSSQQAQDDFTREISPLLPSGSENCSEMNQVELQREFPEAEPRIKNTVHRLDQLEQKRNTSKEKGTCSIMKYFHGQYSSCSSSKQSKDNFIQEASLMSPSGSESYSGLNLTEPQIEFPGEETKIEYAGASLDQQEDRKNLWKNQDASCLSSQQAQDDFTREISPLLPSGSENCSEMNQVELQREFPEAEPRIKNTVHRLDQLEQKRNTSKEKGTISILRFFKNCDPCSSSRKQEHVETIQDVQAPSSVGFVSTSSNCSELNQAELPKESITEEIGTSSGRCSSSHAAQRRDAWDYKVDEIDPSVVDELPPEIQEEVRAWLRPHKRPNVVKRGSSIAHYFLPAKNR